MAQKIENKLSPALLALLGGTIYDLSMDLATMETPLNEMEHELYVECHALKFLHEELCRNITAQCEILFSASKEDFHNISEYETRIKPIPNLITIKRGNTAIDVMTWNRIIAHFFERFLITVKRSVLSK